MNKQNHNPNGGSSNKKQLSLPALVKRSVIEKALVLDAKFYGVDANVYAEENRSTYTVALSLWSQILRDNVVNGRGMYVDIVDLFEQYITRFGLVNAISEGDLYAVDFLAKHEGRETSSSYQTTFWDSLSSELMLNVQREFLGNDAPMGVYVRQLLLCCRYLKRLSPQGIDSLKDVGLEKFRRIEQRNSDYNTSEKRDRFFDLHLSYRVSEIIHEVLKGYKCQMSSDHLMEGYDPELDGYYSTGSQIVGCSMSEKDSTWTIRTSNIKAEKILMNPRITYDFATLDDVCSPSIVKIAAVNKSYKTCRIIGQECADRAYAAQCVNRALRKAACDSKYGKCFHFDDQRENALACALASVDGRLATIDQTSASDSIVWSAIASWFPQEVTRDLWKVRPKYAVIAGKQRRLEMAFSSGHACTATIQTIVFFAIDLAVTEYVATFLGKRVIPSKDIIVYNDDQVVPSFAVEAIRDAHSKYGLITNIEKSYWEGSYREACGEEMWEGISVSHSYFPRATLNWQALPEVYSVFVEMQGRVNTAARNYLERVLVAVVTAAGKRPTYSESGYDIRSSLFKPTTTTSKRPGSIQQVRFQIVFSSLSPETTWLSEILHVNDIADVFMKEIWLTENKEIPYSVRRLLIEYCKNGSRDILDCSVRITFNKNASVVTGVIIDVTSIDWNASMANRSDDPSFEGELHLIADSVEKGNALKCNVLDTLELDMFRYRTFLKEGPRYADNYCRMLGVSEKPVSTSKLCSKPSVVWGYLTER